MHRSRRLCSCRGQTHGHFVPGSPFENPPCFFLSHTALLLEKEWYSRCQALVTNFFDPFFFNRSSAGTRFATDNHPIYAAKIKMLHSLFLRGRSAKDKLVDCEQLRQIIPQMPAPRRMPQLPQRLGFDLADALARHVEVAADFLQCVVLAVNQTEAQFEHLALALG